MMAKASNGSCPYLLVSKAVEWASEPVHSGSKREVRIREGRPDKMNSVGGHVASLMICTTTRTFTIGTARLTDAHDSISNSLH